MTTITIPGLVYPFDPTGTQATNKVTNEQHIITSSNWRDYHFIVPKCAPFFEDSVKLRYRAPDNSTRYLVKNVDWYPTHKFMDASLACAKPISGSISFLNAALEGVVIIEEYQTVGGNWVLDSDKLALILADRLHNPRITSWEQVVERPIDFPVIDHEWNLIDMVGMTEVVAGLLGIEEQLRLKGQDGLSGHVSDFANPHRVDKEDVGLGNVFNYGIANDAEAAAGIVNNKYMTPATVRKAIGGMVGGDTAHKLDLNNPHNTTAAQVGAFTKAEVNALLDGKLNKNAIAYDTARISGLTPDQFKDYVLEGIAADSILFNGMTFNELKLAVQGGSSGDSDLFNGMTFEQVRDLILEGTAENANKFGGKTPAEFIASIAALDVGNALTLNNRTDVQLKAWILASPASSATLFGGMDANAFKTWVLTGTAANATTFNGKTYAQATAEIRNGMANEARLFGGKDSVAYRDHVLTGTAANATKFGGFTYAEILAQIRGSISNTSASMVGNMPAQTVVDSVGAWSMRPLPFNDLNYHLTPTGTYSIFASGLNGTKPPGEDGNGALLVLREDVVGANDTNGNYIPGSAGFKVVQQYFNNSRLTPITWIRAFDQGAWGSWSRLIDDTFMASYVEAEVGDLVDRVSDMESNWSTNLLPIKNLDSIAIPSGSYYVSASDPGTKPPGNNGFGHVIISRENISGLTVNQIYFDNFSTTQWVRNYNSGSWYAWEKIILQSNMNSNQSPYNNVPVFNLMANKNFAATELSALAFFGKANLVMTLPDVTLVTEGKIITFKGNGFGGTVNAFGVTQYIYPIDGGAATTSIVVGPTTVVTLTRYLNNWHVIDIVAPVDPSLRTDITALTASVTALQGSDTSIRTDIATLRTDVEGAFQTLTDAFVALSTMLNS